MQIVTNHGHLESGGDGRRHLEISACILRRAMTTAMQNKNLCVGRNYHLQICKLVNKNVPMQNLTHRQHRETGGKNARLLLQMSRNWVHFAKTVHVHTWQIMRPQMSCSVLWLSRFQCHTSSFSGSIRVWCDPLMWPPWFGIKITPVPSGFSCACHY